MRNYIYIILAVALITSCGEEKKGVKKEDAVVEKKVEVPSFNEDSAYAHAPKAENTFGPEKSMLLNYHKKSGTFPSRESHLSYMPLQLRMRAHHVNTLVHNAQFHH